MTKKKQTKKEETKMSETYNADLDFNIDEDAKLPPLVPDGTYHANITQAVFDQKKTALVFKVTLVNNDQFCTDGETPTDGQTMDYSLWFPKPSDANEMTNSGKQTKKQYKINTIKLFKDKMHIASPHPAELIRMAEEAEFIGMEVDVRVGTREWNGMLFNEIKDIFVPVTPTF